MKKLILIPSLAIASTLPALTIISCGDGGNSAQWKQSDGEFVWKHKTPTLSVPSWDGTSEYFKHVSKKILADDFVKSRADAINDSSSSNHYKNWKISVVVNKIDTQNHRCSFTISESGDKEIYYENDYIHYDYTATLVDIPINIRYAEYFDAWFGEVAGITPGSEPVITNGFSLEPMYYEYKTWSFTIKGTIQGLDVDNVLNYDCLGDIAQEKHQTTLGLMAGVSWDSYFFKNVTVIEENN